MTWTGENPTRVRIDGVKKDVAVGASFFVKLAQAKELKKYSSLFVFGDAPVGDDVMPLAKPSKKVAAKKVADAPVGDDKEPEEGKNVTARMATIRAALTEAGIAIPEDADFLEALEALALENGVTIEPKQEA